MKVKSIFFTTENTENAQSEKVKGESEKYFFNRKVHKEDAKNAKEIL